MISKAFRNTVKYFRKHGYSVTFEMRYVSLDIMADEEFQIYLCDDVAILTGRGVRGWLADNQADFSERVDGRVTVDNVRCYDKLIKCPMRMKLPETKEKMRELLKHLRFLASDSGCDHSNTYEYIDNPVLPME